MCPSIRSPPFVQNFVQGLSILSRGTLEEKLCWTFSLYDINHDGKITREEMTDIVTAIYLLMGDREDGGSDEAQIKTKVDQIFEVGCLREGIFFIVEPFLRYYFRKWIPIAMV